MIKRKEVLSLTRRKSKQGGCVVLITKENGVEREEFLFGPAGAKYSRKNNFSAYNVIDPFPLRAIRYGPPPSQRQLRRK